MEPELSMDEDSESESENGDEMEADDNLEPISEANIIPSGRRTRGKTIDWEQVRNKNSDEMEEDEDDDEDYQGGANDDDQMRD
ncbi:hypothetical protein F1880_005548 [Penicillium rolfsii]|nr:hypothetical protein F1880_005548 [Penicillium rolfsii]